MTNKNGKLSVFISLILRHKPDAINIKLDEFGYANVGELIDGVNKSGRHIDFDILQQIVQQDKKDRYSFNEDKTLIRANQGHSIDVAVSLTEVIPPQYLYHGTATRFAESIMMHGINKMSRLHVHLSDNKETALQVGKRHGMPVFLTIDALKMYKDGYKFYLSKNNVFLTEFVPSEYIKVRR
ncbi:RNA--NAD 2'-phosphotransferase [Bacillus cereus]|uniref:Probable RNA 2'-phosphotransferase n=1 Tax=Bacillus thuringiensis TaxID=1428 RepID=A0AB36VFB8_BACTU|nr:MULTISPECIES: RNA 2'-phosphotransferase [Bacillus cereus group]PDZ55727.1 RNA--NAD 2'-phosphotransferase [Bacillus cereus]PFO26197.1 RNA--NAD 2'-phosphotransferase [Bacillus thuringiensis]PFS40347.1 RNA--NAD 2'-phosphotransferase [Bacillus thuringiensis]PFS58196.1 RNA--NAD 2'-phosphotransferase [Bacillus thuringiensis]PGZ04966.1 RNA--NAD 2'-phosphotransferase [Bacillus thuringiensis]